MIFICNNSKKNQIYIIFVYMAMQSNYLRLNRPKKKKKLVFYAELEYTWSHFNCVKILFCQVKQNLVIIY